MRPSLLDSDTLSEIIKGHYAAIVRRAETYLTQHVALSFSLITRFEILRGLKAKRANVQHNRFEGKCRDSNGLPLTDEIVVLAADLYAYLRARGRTIDDADLFIAATARVHNLVVVTNNRSHFDDIPDLSVESWADEG